MSGEVSPEIIQKTQTVLGKYVKKPPLTEKLLKKPPFRFLHDIVKAVIKETGFLKGLFTHSELNSDNVKEKDAKVAFLNKLISAVKTITKVDLSVRSSKIVAGLEPVETNLLLQAIGRAIDKKLDSDEYVKSLNSTSKTSIEKKKVRKTEEKEVKKTNKTAEENDKKSTTKKALKKSSSNLETPKSTDRTKSNTSKESISKKNVKKKEGEKHPKGKQLKEEPMTVEPKINSVPPSEVIDTPIEPPVENDNKDLLQPNDEKPTEEVKCEPDAATAPAETAKESNLDEPDKYQEKPAESHVFKRQNSAALVRPKSARPKSGEREHITSARPRNAETQLNPVEMSTSAVSQRPKSSLRPPSVRPPSARPGAPRLRPESALPVQETITMGNINVIVENVDVADDEETVVIQTATETVEDAPPAITDLNVPEDNKGHLVEQILKQIEEEGEDIKRKVDIDWEEDAMRGKEAASKEITQLRALIQNLTKTANPLGKLLNYLHEDIETMHSELQMWSNTKKQLFKEIEKQKKITDESNKPLLAQLEQVQQEIKKQEEEIINVRSNILRNDLRIKELLIK